MAQFDEERVINALHPEKAEVGKKYWYSDALSELKRNVEKSPDYSSGTLTSICKSIDCPFSIDYEDKWQFIYPCEEPPKQRMSNIQFMEWLTKGNGLYSRKGASLTFCGNSYLIDELNEIVDKDIIIRTWDSEEWIEPTVDIYIRDCKGGKE